MKSNSYIRFEAYLQLALTNIFRSLGWHPFNVEMSRLNGWLKHYKRLREGIFKISSPPVVIEDMVGVV